MSLPTPMEELTPKTLESTDLAPAEPHRAPAARITSIDALRGWVMFTMIFVNDLAGAPRGIVPWWLRHFKSDGGQRGQIHISDI